MEEREEEHLLKGGLPIPNPLADFILFILVVILGPPQKCSGPSAQVPLWGGT